MFYHSYWVLPHEWWLHSFRHWSFAESFIGPSTVGERQWTVLVFGGSRLQTFSPGCSFNLHQWIVFNLLLCLSADIASESLVADDLDLNLDSPVTSHGRHLHLEMIPPPPMSHKVSSAPAVSAPIWRGLALLSEWGFTGCRGDDQFPAVGAFKG